MFERCDFISILNTVTHDAAVSGPVELSIKVGPRVGLASVCYERTFLLVGSLVVTETILFESFRIVFYIVCVDRSA